MANYLLLRNNKESGPYSVDDLIKLGLKAYDLLWVQGKSAAWRYPGEIDELKSFAPAVEEQPFDRFYKKPAEEKQKERETEREREIVREPVPDAAAKDEKPITEPQYEKYIPKKSVAVTLPAQQNIAAQKPAREEVPVTPQPTITISENPAAAQTKYSQPLDEIKEMYVKTLYDRKQKIARKTFWLQSMKKAAVVLSLVAVGAVVGFVLKPGKNKQVATVSTEEKKIPSQQAKTDPVVTTTDSSFSAGIAANAAEPAQILHPPSGGYVNQLPPVDRKESSAILEGNETGNKNEKEKQKEGEKEKDIAGTYEKTGTTRFVPESLESDPVTGERNRKVRSTSSETVDNNAPGGNNTVPAERKSPVVTGEIYNLVSVKSNEYKRVAFGGIRDLQLTVTNDSKYILDNVVVELQYIKPNELPLKTENIQFSSIGPNATSTIRVPDTNRGIKVVFRIIHIKKKPADERVADN